MGEDEKLKGILIANNKDTCPSCNRVIDRGDCAWNTGSTGSGTGYSVMEIICLNCNTEIFYGTTWYDIESFEEFIRELESHI